ncbi:MAG: sensor histidine kinase [Ilumatobacter sp.]|nr:sensor histidine kinase [Ilumatobacter sp.]
MDLLLVLLGAGLAFPVGWWAARRRGDDAPAGPVERAPEPARAPVDRFELVEQHRVGAVVSDDRGRVLWRNPAAAAMSGTHVGVLVDESVERHIAAALADGQSREVLEMYGPPKVVLVVDAHRLASGGVVVFIDDVSERRRIEQVRTDFVANISHELKTPVGALAVLAETLEDETDPETIRRVVDRMQGEAARAARTIDDLLELSRIELGGERSIEPIRLPDVISEAMGRVAELAAQREVGVSNLMAADRFADIVVQGDRRQLISALGNLVENGVKYSEPGGLVQVRARYYDGIVEISVTDEGIGIPQRDLDRIFERFYRVDKARSRETGGTGLGLSIVRHVAQNQGGDVAVTSVEGEGSTFTLRLPARCGSTADDFGGNIDTTLEPSSDIDPAAGYLTGDDPQQGIA